MLISEVSLAAAMAEIWLHLGHKISNLFEVHGLIDFAILHLRY